MPYRGRMPVFGYLSADEASYVYLYLTLYPPSKGLTLASTSGAQVPPPPAGRLYNDNARPFVPGSRKGLLMAVLELAIFPVVLFGFLAAVLIRALIPTAQLNQEREHNGLQSTEHQQRLYLTLHPPHR